MVTILNFLMVENSFTEKYKACILKLINGDKPYTAKLTVYL